MKLYDFSEFGDEDFSRNKNNAKLYKVSTDPEYLNRRLSYGNGGQTKTQVIMELAGAQKKADEHRIAKDTRAIERIQKTGKGDLTAAQKKWADDTRLVTSAGSLVKNANRPVYRSSKWKSLSNGKKAAIISGASAAAVGLTIGAIMAAKRAKAKKAQRIAEQRRRQAALRG